MGEVNSVTVVVPVFQNGKLTSSQPFDYDEGRSFGTSGDGNLLVFDDKGNTIATHAAGFWTMAHFNIAGVTA